ncbi:hypothetical protein HOLleu_15761 [Holothuria leucospilota]|uniref:Uncharacterized protein n=1 Tax=Holothuria leucospilota TaxID=206669 RepID=A0A9Q1C570_HOLLE|nr:hypothetical protein HOLleu_15761 [Holothuria leucospilota]
MKMRYSEKMNPKVFGGGQRSCGVTRGQKEYFPRVSKIITWAYQRSISEISQEYPRLSSGVPRGQKANFARIPKIAIWGHQRSKRYISQEFPRLNRNTKTVFFQLIKTAFDQ